MSRDHIPPRPSGSSREARFMQSQHDKAHGPSTKIIDSDTVKVRSTTRGISLHVKPRKGGGGESVTLKKFYFQSSKGDYFWATNVKTPAPSGTTATYTAIAKSSKLRNSITGEVIDGQAIGYTYTAYTADGEKYLRRDAKNGNLTEKQVIVPRFLLNDPIYAMEVEGGTGVNIDVGDPNQVGASSQTVDYIDLNIDARAWAEKADQTT